MPNFSLRKYIKNLILHELVRVKADSLFRILNNNKLMIVTYHGVTTNHYNLPIWTQLPVSVFRRQLDFIMSHYTIISLERLLEFIRGEADLPVQSALLTFDDGLKNNYTVVFPLLKELRIPATIFLTSEFINSTNLLWFDELYLLLRELHFQGSRIAELDLFPEIIILKEQGGEFSYFEIVNRMKRLPASQREKLLQTLRKQAFINSDIYRDDFCALDWEQIKVMKDSGLVSFGAHTANHEILTNLSEDGLVTEVVDCRKTLEMHLGCPVLSFCYPNGYPGLDFSITHKKFLKNKGFLCAFSTENRLNSLDMDPFALGRFSVGNDETSNPDYFRLKTSGMLRFATKFRSLKSVKL